MVGYVYILQEWDNAEKRYKIGVSKNEVEKRIKQLATGNSSEIVLVDKYECENYRKVETMLHRYFASKHKRGEWFELDDSQRFEFISKCEEYDKLIKFLIKENPFYK